MSMSVKVYFDDEIRRFSFPRSKTGPVYSELVKKIREACGGLDLSGYALNWKDQEGDLITFSTDSELLEAMQWANDGILRVYITAKKVKVNGINAENTVGAGDRKVPIAQEPRAPPQTGQKRQHPNITCDGCDKSVYGIRFKCLTCPDYDLCIDCEAGGCRVNVEHPMIRIASPDDSSWHLSWAAHQQGWQGIRPRMMRQWMEAIPHGHGFRRECRRQFREWRQNQRQQQRNGQQENATGEGDLSGEQQEATGHAGGGIPNNPFGEQFLRNVGEQIAHVLNGFGIDVDVDVDERPVNPTSDGGQQQQQPEQNVETEVKKSMEPEQPKEQVTPSAPVELEAEAPQQEMDTTTVPPQNVVNVDNLVDPLANINVNEARSPQDWTFVENNVDSTSSGQGLYPNVEEAQRASKLDAALGHMLNMGFTNDNGWLASLLASKNGDISAVLDALSPASRPL